MKLKNKLIYLTISLILFGCIDSKNSKKILTNGNSKKWILEEYISMYGESRKLNIRLIEFNIEAFQGSLPRVNLSTVGMEAKGIECLKTTPPYPQE